VTRQFRCGRRFGIQSASDPSWLRAQRSIPQLDSDSKGIPTMVGNHEV
jgi:hypothetical protein